MASGFLEIQSDQDSNLPINLTSNNFTGQRDDLMELQMNLIRQDPKSYLSDVDARPEEKQSVLDERPESTKSTPWQRSSLKHMHDLYETVAEITVEPCSKDEPDVKAFFKLLRNHRLQSKLVYVLTVVSIVAISHFVLTVKWLLPYYYTITTPILIFLRLIMYWKMKYQFFMLDFCYFANTYWYLYIWLAPENPEFFVVGFAVANGPLVWALFVFRNSLVFHSLDKVTSLYIHLLPSLLSFVIRWYPEETSKYWVRPFKHHEIGFSFYWLVLLPFIFVVLHQVFYLILVDCILKPSDEYLTMYRYLTNKESSVIFRMCNMLGQRFRLQMYVAWGLTVALIMLLFNPVWYNFFIPHCVVLVFFIIIAIYNGATYYIDVFSLEGLGKSKQSKSELATANNVVSPTNDKKVYSAVVDYNKSADNLKPVTPV
ncbi:uncharacterized protein LOC131938484 [Physella acuta]|uniref:uncharacterized protein LOC131938484 n=1 Tax=Physella acuta TaxID=109671 RepID=UPI0027DE3938|nr:uncharacterized protein LOC131938484 [Physella acuta]XP_059152525.1 uncharacterized protein LOC131938484 [Physella acuta]